MYGRNFTSGIVINPVVKRHSLIGSSIGGNSCKNRKRDSGISFISRVSATSRIPSFTFMYAIVYSSTSLAYKHFVSSVSIFCPYSINYNIIVSSASGKMYTKSLMFNVIDQIPMICIFKPLKRI